MTDIFSLLASIRSTITYSFWANPEHGQTVEQLAEKMNEIGNVVLEVQPDRVLIGHRSENDDVWGCRLCIEHNQVVIVDNEGELMAHVADVHPDWTGE